MVKIMLKLIFRPGPAAGNKEEKSKINLPTPSHTFQRQNFVPAQITQLDSSCGSRVHN